MGFDALRRETAIRPGWSTARVGLRSELFAGMVGALLVIPQAITFAYLAGLPPEYGIYGAIFVTLFASLFGNSVIISGPNTAVAILIGGAVIAYAGRGSPLYIEIVLILTFMVGCIQLLIWALRGGNYFQYFNPPAIAGILHAVGILIMASALDGIVGSDSLEVAFFYEKLLILFGDPQALINPYSVQIGLVTIVAGIAARYHHPRYYLLTAVGAGFLYGQGVELFQPQVVTEVELLGRLPFRPLPFSAPEIFTWEYFLIAQQLLPTAGAIALIGLAQTLVMARQMRMEGNAVDLHKETYAQGASNLLGSFLSSFAGSGSFNRTAVNQEMGARTPLAGIFSALGVALIIPLLGPILQYMPTAVMAGILFIVGLGMLKPRQVKSLLRVRQDAFNFLVVMLSVLVIGLDIGILVAAVLSVVPFILGATRVKLREIKAGKGVLLELHGNLFYASLDTLSAAMTRHREKNIILNLRHVAYLDHYACRFIAQETDKRAAQNRKLVIYVPDRHHEQMLARDDSAGR
ncbi:MAG: SulP family inorganic anion transporter, partial [Pseudomonadota bacterium]